MNVLLEPFGYDYMVNAMWVSALVGCVCGFLSAYLMLKGWSLIGDALSHSIVPGVAGAYMLGLPFAAGAFLSGGLAAAAMLFLNRATRLKEDAIIGMIFTSFFGLGLFMAIVLNHPKVRGRKVYRSLLIVPYAFPAFLTALVWQGMLNRDFGFVNATLLGGASIPWLTDPWLAKVSVLVVNLWLGFPYMFLICTGALQSIPGEIYEAGKIDGAKPFRLFRSLTMPLLLVSTAPLLISSFAFNFNNFNVVYLLTEGGPDNLSAPVDVGATDILITFVYRLAFGGVNRQYGLACAVSILIFLIVASISAATFSKTRALEDLH